MITLFAFMLPAAAVGVAVSFQRWASRPANVLGLNVEPVHKEDTPCPTRST